MQTLTHHGRETAYEEHTRSARGGPTILFVHGSGGQRSLWNAQSRLTDVATVVRLDLSGHGDSEDVDASPGFPCLSAYADDVLAVADAVDADVLVGSSLGGAVALHCVLARDATFDGLVLSGTGARLAVLDDLLDWLAHDFERALEFLHAPGRLFADPDDELVDASKTTMRECGRVVTERDFRTCHSFDVRDDLNEVTTPVLAIVGEHDRLTPPWYHEYLVENVGGRGDFALVEDAAHLSMLERPSAFNAAIREFWETL